MLACCLPAGFRCVCALLVLTVAMAGGCGWRRSGRVSPSSSLQVVQGTMARDEIWEGRVEITDDFLIPAGRTLRIRAGTTVLVQRADTSRTEPEFLSNSTEFLVRGRLIVEGDPARPVVFEPLPPKEAGEDEDGGEAWAGIIFDRGGGSIRSSIIRGGEYGMLLLSSSPRIEKVTVTGVKHGLSLHGVCSPTFVELNIEASEWGIYCLPGWSALMV
jgi:hypothetical protein